MMVNGHINMQVNILKNIQNIYYLIILFRFYIFFSLFSLIFFFMI